MIGIDLAKTVVSSKNRLIQKVQVDLARTGVSSEDSCIQRGYVDLVRTVVSKDAFIIEKCAYGPKNLKYKLCSRHMP